MMRFALLCLAAVQLANGSPQCLDENGSPVDWYVVYKYPYLKDSKSEIFGGYRYGFISSKASDGWHLSPQQTTNPHSIFGKTLSQIYENPKLNFAFYNDQPPGDQTAPASFAHAKGAMAGDEHTGFWLIHTVPHLAPGNGSYDYPRSGGRFGQVAMCISMSSAQLANVVDHQMRIAQPFAYSIHNSDTDSPLARAMKLFKAKDWRPEHSSDLKITSLGNVEFRSFYKNPNYHFDLYSEIVSPALNSPLQVETWRKNPGHPLDSACEKKNTKVENINAIHVSFVNSKEEGKFDYKDDHSKWAMTEAESKLDIVCIGDINRVESQFKRGGGTTCFKNAAVWKSFSSYVGGTDRCH